MTKTHRQPAFRAKVLRTFFLFQLLLVLLGIGWVTISFTDGQDSLQEAILLSESEHFLTAYAQDPTLAFPRSVSFSAYPGFNQLPAKYQTLFQGLPVGLHELYDLRFPGSDIEHELRVLIQSVPQQDSPLYFVSDIPEAETEALLVQKFISVIATYIILAILVGGWLAWLFARNISRPLEQISHDLEQLQPEDPSTRLSDAGLSEEIARVVRAINTQNQRLADFLQREQQIMRNVSHELRTPITIIKSSLALVERPTPGDNAGVITIAPRFLNKINRAALDLEKIVEACLWLGRENKCDDSLADVTACVERAIADNHYLTEGKTIHLDVDLARQVKLAAREQLVVIAAANLVRNAFTHTAEGTVRIKLTERCLMVQDQGPGFGTLQPDKATQAGISGAESSGFGLGLHIVDQICDRLGWQLEIQSNASGAIVTIHFLPSGRD